MLIHGLDRASLKRITDNPQSTFPRPTLQPRRDQPRQLVYDLIHHHKIDLFNPTLDMTAKQTYTQTSSLDTTAPVQQTS